MPAISRVQLYGQISKVEEQDDGSIMVHGIASTEQVDSVGEIVRADAMRAALPGYMIFPALREMHGLSAAGTTLEAEVGDDGITRIVAHVVDESAIKKVKSNTYRGFSIGGKVTKRNPDDRKIIEGLSLSEISLVDRPANAGSILEMWKADGAEDDTGGDAPNSTENDMSTKKAATPAAEAATDPVEKTIVPAAITPTKLVDVLNDGASANEGTALNTPVAGKHVDPVMPGGSTATEVAVANPEEAGQATPKPLGATDTPVVEHVAPAAATPGTDQRTRKDAAADADPISTETVTDPATKAAEEDPIALAMAAADSATKAATAILLRLNKRANGGISAVLAPGMELRKGLSATARLGCLLGELAYSLSDAKWESDYEGDNSPVPEKIHAALQSLAAAYKAMSDEELQELLDAADKTMSAQIALATSGGDLGKALDGVVDAETLAKVAGSTDQDALAKALQANEDLLKTVGGLTESLNTLAEKVEALENTPMPAKTITKAADPALIAVGKEQDGQPRIEEIAKAAEGPTVDDVRKALDSMSEDERAMRIMKASLSPVNARHITR